MLAVDPKDNMPKVQAVDVTSADFNGHSWDAFPFSDNPAWLIQLVLLGYITLARDDTDYAQFDVKTAKGVVRASAGDRIFLTENGLEVVEWSKINGY